MAGAKYVLGPSPLMVMNLPTATKGIHGVIRKARHDLNRLDIYQFLNRDNKDGVCQLYAVVSIYAECLRETNAMTRTQLERMWTSCYDHPSVKEAVDELLDVEELFEDLVDDIEKALRLREKEQATKGSALSGNVLPKDLGLILASSGKPTTLEACWMHSKYTLFVLLRHFG